jgi:hypothetical protein
MTTIQGLPLRSSVRDSEAGGCRVALANGHRTGEERQHDARMVALDLMLACRNAVGMLDEPERS